MIQKRLWILSILLISSIALVGCGHAEAESLEAIDPAAWPNPPSAAAIPSPTPFPKIYLEDVVSEDLRISEDATASEDSVNETAQPGDIESNDETATVETETDQERLPAIAQAEVTSFALNMRQGPGVGYDPIGTLSQGDNIAVLALSPEKDWALVESPNPGVGWVSLKHLAVDGSLQNAPVLNSTPADLVSEVSNNHAEQNVNPPEAIQVSYGAEPSPTEVTSPFEELTPVAVAHIGKGEVDVRPAYSLDREPIDTITADQEDIHILAADPSGEWALAQPTHAKVGWIALSDLEIIEGSVADAPQVFTAWTNSNALTLRSGPGIFHNAVGELPINNLVVVLGLNEGRSWASIKPVVGQGQGWVQIKYLTLSEPVSDLPLAPTPPPAPTPIPLDPAVAEASAEQGKLVFQTSSGGEIMIINADGTGLRHLTYGIDPALSPDGQTVAFTRWAQGEGNTGSVWLIDVDGGNERQIMEFVKQPKGPEWSPDGSQLVINFQHQGRLDDKTVRVNLARNQDPAVPWNAEDAKVVYEPVIVNGQVVGAIPYLKYTLPPDPHWGLRVVNIADGSFEDMNGGTYAFRPAWDPVQDWRIVSDGGNGLLEVDVNRAEYQLKLTENMYDGSPTFSPNGQYLALSAGTPDSSGYNIYRLNNDGSGRMQLTKTPLWTAVTPEGEGQQWNYVSPAWSPDGTQIAFLTDRSGDWEIWVMNADGSNQRPMFSDEINTQLNLTYDFVDERAISWR